MAAFLGRIVAAFVLFSIGIFWAFVTFTALFVRSILGGPTRIAKVFRKKKHNVLPEVVRKNFKHNYVRTRSGMRFHYVHTGSEDDPLMLCLHGFPECWYSWRHVLKRFSSKYHVVAFDMRGYGGSDKPKSVGDYHLDYLVNDVQEIISALGYQRAVIVSHDWGGAVAWKLPLFFPEVVSKLIVMNCPNQAGFREFVGKFPSQLLKSWYMFFFQVPWLPEFFVGMDDYKMLDKTFNGRQMGIQNKENRLKPDEIEIYKNAVASTIKYSINYYRAVNPIYQGMQLPYKTKQIVQPTLLIWGDKDGALDARMVPFCEKQVPGISTHIIPGASHWVVQDEPEKVLKIMEDFLESNE